MSSARSNVVFWLLVGFLWHNSLAKKVLIIPDAHGDSEHLLQALKNVGMTSNFTLPDNSSLVQLGDLTDRGPNTTQCFDILRQVSANNPSPGQVVRLIGNHEAFFGMQGITNYAHPADIKSFCAVGDPDTVCRKQWSDAFSPDGLIGREIRDSFQLVHVFRTAYRQGGAGDGDGLLPMDSPNTLFVHAGLEPHVLAFVDTLPRGEADAGCAGPGQRKPSIRPGGPRDDGASRTRDAARPIDANGEGGCGGDIRFVLVE